MERLRACTRAPRSVDVLVGDHAAGCRQPRTELLEVAPELIRCAAGPVQVDVLTATVGQAGRRSCCHHRRCCYPALGDEYVGCGAEYLRLVIGIVPVTHLAMVAGFDVPQTQANRPRFHARCANWGSSRDSTVRGE